MYSTVQYIVFGGQRDRADKLMSMTCPTSFFAEARASSANLTLRPLATVTAGDELSYALSGFLIHHTAAMASGYGLNGGMRPDKFQSAQAIKPPWPCPTGLELC